jgi:23S rRNA pseudouridine2605 synthase
VVTVETPAAGPKPERIARVIARAGVASRREAERWIAEGRVKLDGVKVASPALNVLPNAAITVDERPLPAREETRVWRYHKPRGLLTTRSDPQGRPTLFEKLPMELGKLISVGRLDLTSEGLLLLTNDGALARRLELPANAWVRRYKARIFGRIQPEHLAALAAGMTIDGVRYGPIEAVLERQQGANAWISLSLTEGKNREVRRVLEHLGFQTGRLIRTAYGPFHLGTLERGKMEEVTKRVLKTQLGLEFAPRARHRREP